MWRRVEVLEQPPSFLAVVALVWKEGENTALL